MDIMEQKKRRRWLVKISFPTLVIGMYISSVYMFDDSPRLFVIANLVFIIMVFESLRSGWKKSCKISTPRGILLLYSAWVTISVIWAWDKAATIGDIKRQIVFTVLLISIVNVLRWDENAIKKV